MIIDEELFHDPLLTELTRKTLALAHRLGCVTNYYHDHHIYAVVRNEDQMELTKRYGKLTASAELYRYLNEGEGELAMDGTNDDGALLYNEGNAYGYQGAVDLGPPSKLLILCPTERLDDITDAVRRELNGSGETERPPQANVVRGTPPFFVEILDPTVHKGRGLVRLCESLGVTPE